MSPASSEKSEMLPQNNKSKQIKVRKSSRKHYIISFLCFNGLVFGGGLTLLFPKIFNAILDSVRKNLRIGFEGYEKNH